MIWATGSRARKQRPWRRYSCGSRRRGQDHADANADVVVDGRRIGPFAFSNPVLESLQRKRAFGDAIARAVVLHRDRHDAVPRDALDRELAGDFVAIAAQAPD